MPGRKTRKARGLTVESLHASFERIDKKVHAMIGKGSTDSELGSCLHKAWSEQFHMPVSGSAVKALIMHYRAVHPGSKRLTRKSKRQRGGMAPVDYMMGQGQTSQLYGRFPVEMGVTPNVVTDLDLARFYESSTARSCNTTGGHPALNQRGGYKTKRRRQRGGGGETLWETLMAPSNIMSTVYNGHAPHSVPVNTVQSAANTVMGGTPITANPSPVASSVHLVSHTPRPYDTNISDMSNYATIYKPT